MDNGLQCLYQCIGSVCHLGRLLPLRLIFSLHPPLPLPQRPRRVSRLWRELETVWIFILVTGLPISIVFKSGFRQLLAGASLQVLQVVEVLMTDPAVQYRYSYRL